MPFSSTVPGMSRIDLPRPYLLFLGDTVEAGFAKTAFGLRDWAPELCVGEYALPAATVTAGLRRLTPAEAYAGGARSLVIGVANGGGVILPSWSEALVEALGAGLDIVSGMHTALRAVPQLVAAARRHGRRLIDVRVPPTGIPIATGKKRTGRRLLTIDAVVADFEAGAAEMLSPDAAFDHWDVIEGQGSLFHPAYAAVSLGLLHGSQPDVIVLCDQPGRTHVLGFADYPLPTPAEAIDLNLRLGRRTNPAIRCGGLSLNTSHLDENQSSRVLDETSREVGLPAADPMRPGERLDRLVDSCLGSGAR
jgi:uncharacterized NAD-dependent epimerase/dehydratase family protein